MKKIYLALLALTLGVSAQAQRTIVLKVELLKPALDTNVVTGSTQYPSYKISNVSLTAADSISAKDTIRFKSPSNILGQYTNLYGVSLPMGTFLTLSDATISGGYKLAFANIETLVNLTADTFKVKPFTNNKQYLWYVQLTGFSAGPGVPGVTSATVTNPLGLDTTRIWINKTPTGIDEISFEGPSIKTFPNPAANQLSFEYNFETSEKATATIMDAAGRTVLVKEFENNNIGNQRLDLDITSISNGMYFLKVNVGDNSSTTKFNVQK